MYTKIKIFGLKYQLIPLIVILISITILNSLGNWQLHRLSQKKSFIQKIHRNIVSPPLVVHNINHNIQHYDKIEIEGKFLKDKHIFLYGKRSAALEKDGYYLISPFKTKNNQILLVSRGWMPQSTKNNFYQYNQSTDQIKIIGITLPSETQKLFVPKNDTTKSVWFNLDLNMAKENIGIDITSFYLMQVNSSDLPKGAKPLSDTYLNKIQNNHMEYAITWYSLSIVLAILFIIYGRTTD